MEAIKLQKCEVCHFDFNECRIPWIVYYDKKMNFLALQHTTSKIWAAVILIPKFAANLPTSLLTFV